ncbi:hypothetical protein D3C78_882650 [compost metagenome]
MACLQRQCGQIETGDLHNRRFHQFERHAGGDVKDFPFVTEVVTNVAVARIDAQLLLTAEHQHRSASNDQRPKGFELGFGQRIERMVGLDGRQDAQWIALGMMEQGRAGYRQVGDSPGVQQITEIDDPLQLPLALLVTLPDSVVIGDVQMHSLHRQLLDQWLQALLGLGGGG